MEIKWPYFIAALVLLLPPMPFSSALMKAFLSLGRRGMVKPGPALRLWQNWADLVRAALGGWLLIDAFDAPGRPEPDAETKVAALEAGVLVVAVLVQSVRFYRGPLLFGPVFYLGGLASVLGGELDKGNFQGLFALVVGWLFALAGKNLRYQLPAMLLALAAAGYVLGFKPPLLIGTALILVPLVVSVLFRKALLFATA